MDEDVRDSSKRVSGVYAFPNGHIRTAMKLRKLQVNRRK